MRLLEALANIVGLNFGVDKIEIIPEPTNPQERKELHRLQGLVQGFRAGRRTIPDEQTEPHDYPIEMLPDWYPPCNRLLDLEKKIGRKVVGLGDWYAEKDGNLCPDVATPIFEKKSPI